MSTTPHAQSPQLHRTLGVGGAVMMGLGSIVGTGVFVSIGIAAGVAGPAVIVGIAIAAVLATANGLSSAQLAANHPVSGGTYEYGYRYATPLLGFIAGWVFLLAKSASAATAALGLAGYLLILLGVETGTWITVTIALAGLFILTAIVLTGMTRTNAVNIAIVSITLIALASFVIGGLPLALERGAEHMTPFVNPAETFDPGVLSWTAVLHAAALMFVAYTGYGRIATLGEEIRHPKRNIPRAIIITLLVSMVLYLAVGVVAIGAVGSQAFYAATEAQAAPLAVIAREFAWPWMTVLLSLGAITAMAGVLLNLILGLSRVFLAMGRRGDMPRATGRLNPSGTAPTAAVIVVAAIIGGLVLIGDVRIAWSFSAFTVLVYYAITNWCAIRLPREDRLYPAWIAWVGMIACLSLAAFLDLGVVLAGLALIGAGIQWKFFAALAARPKRSASRRG
jgi:basic amino acid/polyamine antiporter, APA family